MIVISLWVSVCGLWPLLDTGHHIGEPFVGVDLLAHFIGLVLLAWYYLSAKADR